MELYCRACQSTVPNYVKTKGDKSLKIGFRDSKHKEIIYFYQIIFNFDFAQYSVKYLGSA